MCKKGFKQGWNERSKMKIKVGEGGNFNDHVLRSLHSLRGI